MASLKSAKKWESLFSCSLQKKIENGKVVMLKCKMYILYEERITSLKGFSQNWIVGTSSVKKYVLRNISKETPIYTLQIFLIVSQWGTSSLADEIVKALPLDVASLKWQLAIKKSWKIVSTQLII